MATKQQVDLIVTQLTDLQKIFYKLPTKDAEWIINNPQEAIDLFLNSVTNRQNAIEESFKKLGRIIQAVRILPVSKKFVAREKFLINTENKKVVRISAMNDSFKEWFLDQIEDSFSGSLLICRNLQEYSGDDVIIAEIGNREKAKTSLREMFYVMEAWSQDKESGLTCKETIDHVFYVKDVQDIIRSIKVNWSKDGWSLDAFPIEDSGEWEVNSRIFYRHSLRD